METQKAADRTLNGEIIFEFLIINRYVPTLWGYSGHLQTVFHSIVGRVKCPWPSGDRIYLTLADNSTLTYDLYQPLNEPKGILNKHLAHTAKRFT